METQKKQYSREEIARNNGADGARVWIIVRDCVYDVTDYLNEHPGGSELILEYAGQDATSGFDDFGHSSDAKKTLKKYEIGVLASSETGKSVKFVKDTSVQDKPKGKQRRKFLRFILGPCANK